MRSLFGTMDELQSCRAHSSWDIVIRCLSGRDYLWVCLRHNKSSTWVPPENNVLPLENSTGNAKILYIQMKFEGNGFEQAVSWFGESRGGGCGLLFHGTTQVHATNNAIAVVDLEF